MNKIYVFLFALLWTISLPAKIQLPAVLSNQMVLQQQTDIKLWGKATSNTWVTIKTSWNNRTFTVQAGKEGNWLVYVPTPLAGGPYEISISDGEEIVLKDILIGEVWFCSGQSNMSMPLQGWNGQPIEGANEVLVKANENIPVRFFTATAKTSPTLQEDTYGEWLKPSSENLQSVSALAYFYGQLLQETLDVPVGLVVSAFGGSKIESWLSYKAVDDIPGALAHHSPSQLYNAMIHPFKNYTIKGFLWYQGENNWVDPELYARLFPELPKDFRRAWNAGELPFYYVQIAPGPYDGVEKTTSARIREVQMLNEKTIPNAGMVVTLDLGGLYGHPSKKKEVGHRLAYMALAKTYGRKGFGYQAPAYKSIEINKQEIIISFEYTSSRCVVPAFVNLENFEVAGADRIFYPATARINERTRCVVVTAEEVTHPIAVRYAYKNFTKASLFDEYDLPVSSFRSDNW